MELIDFTVSEYIRDSAMLGMPKAILAVGHFNTEEPGMEYMVHYIPEALSEAIPLPLYPVRGYVWIHDRITCLDLFSTILSQFLSHKKRIYQELKSAVSRADFFLCGIQSAAFFEEESETRRKEGEPGDEKK